MQKLTLVPFLLILAACGSAKLEKATAEKLIRPDYPAVVLLKVPLTATAEKGSDKLARNQKINELLAKEPWIEVKTEEKDGKVISSYRPSPKAPKTVRPSLKFIEVPAATAEFISATRMEPMDPRRKDGAVKVTFLVRLSKPTGLWPLYEFLHPGASLSQPVERHALLERSGGKWGLIKTDETARINE
jgi:hypothetical protein